MRRYDEREVRRLFRRAAELQHTKPTAPVSTGMTLPELESVAAEAGLDVAHVRQAALELDSGAEPRDGLGAALIGAPTRLIAERVLPFEASTGAFDTLVVMIQAAADAIGQASVVGRTLTWQSQQASDPKGLQVVVSIGDGQTRIRIEERYGALAGGLYGGVLGGVGGGVGIGVGGAIGGMLGSAALAVALPVTIIGGTYAAVRAAYTRIVRRRHRTLHRLLQDIVAQLERDAGDGRRGAS